VVAFEHVCPLDGQGMGALEPAGQVKVLHIWSRLHVGDGHGMGAGTPSGQ